MNDTEEARDRFHNAYRDKPPWDIGRPQPALISLLDEFPPEGPVLEVGCGSGELSLALAERGLTVIGLDFAPAAIARANARAADAPARVRELVEFEVGDALHPLALSRSFRAVVDSGFFHLFGAAERDQFVQELEKLLPNGGRYYFLGFAFDSPIPNAPRRVAEDEVKARFAPARGWRILALHPAEFIIRPAPNGVPSIAACVERVPALGS